MADFLDSLLKGQYAPHGYCLLWQPELIWTHVVSDALIALAYFSIPIALILFVRRRHDLAFSGIFWLFALFITACGATHVMGIWTLWRADYGVEALVKVVTALASVGTAIVLWPLIPRALALPSPAELHRANDALAARIAERDAALAALQGEIAEREKAEQALLQSQKIEAIGQLTGGIAHDFNNILQAAVGNLELIARAPSEADRITRWSDNGLRALERGKRLTAQLLAFSRTQKLAMHPIELAALIENMAELLERTLGPAVSLRIRLGEEEHWAMGDSTQLELAILNLAINARDAMPDGGTLLITLAPHDASGDVDLSSGDYVEIAVSDTGSGMTAEVKARAFEPFFTTKPVGKGTGLGLSMVFGVARQSGGTARIKSEPEGGTTISIILRRTTGIDRGDIATVVGAAAPKALQCRTVLVVDDDEVVREGLVGMLYALGYEPRATDNGRDAITIATAERPDLVLLDFAMPEMNGADIARQIRQAAPTIPIVFASGHAETAALEQVMGERTVMIRKPFSITELAAAIREATGTDAGDVASR